MQNNQANAAEAPAHIPAQDLFREVTPEEQQKLDQLARLFPDVHSLTNDSLGDPKRVLKYYKMRGKWLYNDKYYYDFCWPLQYQQEYQAYKKELRKQRRTRKPGVWKKLMGVRDADDATSRLVLDIPSYESEEGEQEYIFDPTLPDQPEL